jgi:integrase
MADGAPHSTTQSQVRQASSGPASNPVARYKGFLSGVLERAKRVDQLILENLAHALSPLPAEESDFRILDEEEIGALLQLARKQRLPGPDGVFAANRLELAVRVMLHGLGPAEACGLRIEDFDGEGLQISRQAYRVEGEGVKVRSQLKTKRRKAWIPVNKELAELLASLRHEGKAGFVLGTRAGTPMETGNLRRAFAGMVKGTELEGLRPYDLRHTAAMRSCSEPIFGRHQKS